MTFKQRAKLAIRLLKKQKPVTLNQAKAQVAWVRSGSVSKIKKSSIYNK